MPLGVRGDVVNGHDISTNSSEEDPFERHLRQTIPLANDLILADLYGASKELVSFADARRAAIEAKAVSLLTASGLCVTLLSATIGAMTRPEFHPSLWLKLAMVGTLGSGCVAAIAAIAALKTRTNLRAVNPADLFREDTFRLPTGENIDRTEEPTAAELRMNPKADHAHWRRYIAVHYARVAHSNNQIAEAKARAVGRGQGALLGLILGMFLIGVLFVIGISNGQ